MDLAVAMACAYNSPSIANFVAPYLGWGQIPSFSIIFAIPFLSGAAVVSVPIVLHIVGFYRRNNLQRLSSAMRQLFTFVVYYLCMLGLYQSLRTHPGYIYMNHVIIVNVALIPIGIFLRFYLCRIIQLNTGFGRKHLRRVLLAGAAEDIDAGWPTLPAYWQRTLQVAGRAIAGETNSKDIQGLIEQKHVSQLILFGGLDAYRDNENIITQCEVQGIDVYIHLAATHSLKLRADINEIGEGRFLILSSTPVYSWALLLKSILGRILAAVAIVGSSPLWLIAAIGIKASDPKGPVFYKQQRSGLYGKPFAMWKFRSMYVNADKMLDEVKRKYGNEMNGPIFKLTNDPRIFPFGRFIRKYSIDELPQLLNVLKGDMSIVGPRPLPTYETNEFPEISQRRRLSVKPGLTCYWQIEDRSDTKEFCTMVNKDLKYIDNWSLWTDFKLIMRTIPAVLFGKGAK